MATPNPKISDAEAVLKKQAAAIRAAIETLRSAVKVEKKSGGKHRIKVFNKQALGSEKETIDQVKIGALDFTRVNVGPMNGMLAEIATTTQNDPQITATTAISRLRLQANLCVLASCRSLGTSGLDNLSLAGIAPAWLMAGVPAVVATQWNVDDRATAEFMRRFYVALARGGAVGAALQQAQREMRAIPEWSAPRYWAGFVVLGDPGTRVTLAAKR